MTTTYTPQQPTAPAGTGLVALGDDLPRLDAPAKVTGTARYAAEHAAPDLCFGVVVNTPAARGRITAIELDEALAVPGVIDILTHRHRPELRSIGLFYKDMTAPPGRPFRPLHDDRVHYSGQPVALVVAETFEAARWAAGLVRVHVQAEPHDTCLLDHLEDAHEPAPLRPGYAPPPKPLGDAESAWSRAPVAISTEIHHGVEHHNPMEMHATTVVRDPDGHLTLHDKTQGSQNVRWVISRVFGLPRHQVTVKNAYVGGAFGSGLRPQYAPLMAVMAALMLKRSVRVVLTRPQMFTFGHRPECWQRVKLGAEPDGTLVALTHDAVGETSRFEDFCEVVVNWSGQLYRCPNIRLGYKLADLDVYTPMDMRAPGAAHGVHALEVAMDELSYALGMDPLALRLKNYAERAPMEDKPFSTKALRACYEQGAERFGWHRRPLLPRSTREGHEWVGWGMATGTWDAMQMFARVEAVLLADGRLVVSSAASDIGTGTRTVMTQIAAAAMGLPMEHVAFEMGDSRLPLAPVEGGSSHVSTIGSAIAGACEKLQRRLLVLAGRLPQSAFRGLALAEVEFAEGRLRRRDEPGSGIALADLVQQAGRHRVQVMYTQLPDVLKQRKFVRATHSAVFCEVRVDEDFGSVRVTRVVSAIAAGRIISARTARSQIVGGIVWGISQALHEETHADHRLGRFMNHDLSEYHVAVNADIGDIDVIFADEDDRIVSRLGAKGVGEIGIVGVAAAVCNAIYHATGQRVRSTPMTPDKVMAPG